MINSKMETIKAGQAKVQVLSKMYSWKDQLRQLTKTLPSDNLAALISVMLEFDQLPKLLEAQALLGPESSDNLAKLSTIRSGLHRALDDL